MLNTGNVNTRKIDYLRISVTDRCNLRCVYCMPSEGIEQKIKQADRIGGAIAEKEEELESARGDMAEVIERIGHPFTHWNSNGELVWYYIDQKKFIYFNTKGRVTEVSDIGIVKQQKFVYRSVGYCVLRQLHRKN